MLGPINVLIRGENLNNRHTEREDDVKTMGKIGH